MKQLRILATAISCAVIIVTGHAGAQSPETEAKQDAADIARLSELLRIRAGSVVDAMRSSCGTSTTTSAIRFG